MSALTTHLWKPGQSGNLSGRPKKWLTRVDQMLADKNLHPIEELLKLLPRLSPKDRAHVWLEVLSYCQAKPKYHDEEKDAVDELRQLSTQELLKLVKENLPEAAG